MQDMWELIMIFVMVYLISKYYIVFLVILGVIIAAAIYKVYKKNKEQSIAERAPKILTYEERIGEAKETVKEKALDIKSKMSKITGHLSMIKDMNTKDAKAIYDKEKNILAGLYGYYCKFQKIYSDLSFSQILDPDDIAEIKRIDIKDFVGKIKALHRRDYENAVSALKKEDTLPIDEAYAQLQNAVDTMTNALISMQYNIIVQEISPIENDAMLEKIKNRLEHSLAITDYKHIEDNYLKFIDEFKAAKEIFK
jgi:hypothetical protein